MEFIEQVAYGFIILISSGLGGYILNYFRIKKLAISKNRVDIEGIKEDIEILKKILIIIAKKIDKGTKKAHPELDTDITELVKDILSDDYDSNTHKTPI